MKSNRDNTRLPHDWRARRRHFIQTLGEQRGEFINGKKVVHPPDSMLENDVAGNILCALATYVDKHSLGITTHFKALISLTYNDFQPDIAFFARPKAVKFKRTTSRFPPPDLAIEVLSKSSARIDRTIKFEDYAAHGVDEYWIVDPYRRTIEQYLLSDLRYELAIKGKTGTVRSRAAKGFQIPIRAAFDVKENLQALAEIIG